MAKKSSKSKKTTKKLTRSEMVEKMEELKSVQTIGGQYIVVRDSDEAREIEQAFGSLKGYDGLECPETIIDLGKIDNNHPEFSHEKHYGIGYHGGSEIIFDYESAQEYSGVGEINDVWNEHRMYDEEMVEIIRIKFDEENKGRSIDFETSEDNYGTWIYKFIVFDGVEEKIYANLTELIEDLGL